MPCFMPKTITTSSLAVAGRESKPAASADMSVAVLEVEQELAAAQCSSVEAVERVVHMELVLLMQWVVPAEQAVRAAMVQLPAVLLA